MEFPSLERPLIIAMKGLPCTYKTLMAVSISKWAGAPILRIDDFLGDLDGDKTEQLQHAFVSLCKVADFSLLRTNFKRVVIKSRLCSTFELDQLIDLAGLKEPFRFPYLLLIIECQINNEYRWKNYIKYDWSTHKKWNEINKARLDYDAQAWDRYFLELIEQLPHENRHLVRRMIFDTSTLPSQLNLIDTGSLNDPIAVAIKYLLTGNVWDRFQHSVGYLQLIKAHMEEELNTPRERRKYLCTEGLGCVFKYREALEYCEGGYCGVCEKRILGPGYACHFCTLALHKSCAEDISIPDDYNFPEKYSCDSCKHQGSDFSFDCNACTLQTNLKCRVMPTIVKHDAHPQHFLCMCVVKFGSQTCKGCGWFWGSCFYACKICYCFYHPQCLNSPREIKHNHGGYDHVMKIMYSTDGMEEQEDNWCDVCHLDIDPEVWFFSCQECPYYVTHRDPMDIRDPSTKYHPCGTTYTGVSDDSMSIITKIV